MGSNYKMVGGRTAIESDMNAIKCGNLNYTHAYKFTRHVRYSPCREKQQNGGYKNILSSLRSDDRDQGTDRGVARNAVITAV